MMLHLLLATVLSGSPAIPADSVRNAAKTATARPDTTLQSPPGTAITPAKQVPPPVTPVAPVGSTVPSAQGSSVSAPANAAAQSTSPTTSSAWTTTLKSSTVVTSTAPAAAPVAIPATQVSAPVANLVTTKASAPTADSAAPKPAPTSVTAARPQHEVVLQAGTPTSVPVPAGTTVATASAVVSTPRPESTTASNVPAAAPADASAVAAPRAAVTTTRVDARTVVSVRSSERIEPLYSVPLPTSRVRAGAPSIADSIVVYKRERTLTLFYRGIPVRSYFIALGSKPVGDKERAGDQRTPEGLFHINAHNPASKFHLALRISYPDDAHRARAAALGADPGGDIMIHGLPKEYSEAGKDHIANDWTNGCVALSNQEIEEIWRAVPDGTPVQIKP